MQVMQPFVCIWECRGQCLLPAHFEMPAGGYLVLTGLLIACALSHLENLLAGSAVLVESMRKRFLPLENLTSSPFAFAPAAQDCCLTLTPFMLVHVHLSCTGRDTLWHAGHAEAVLAVAFSPSGKQLASGSGDTSLRLWDLNTQTSEHVCQVCACDCAA